MAGLAGVLKGVLSNLSSPLLNEFWLLWGVGEDKVKLQSNLSAINAVLQDAERRQVNDMAVKDWLGKIKAAAHDAEDVLDEFRIEALRRKVENQEADCCGIPLEKVSNLINQPVFHIKMAHKMQKLRKNFEHIAKERDLFKFTERVVVIQPGVSSARETCSKSESEVYGRNTEKADLIKLLIKSENEEDLSVISIVGMGGLGKTTLAQLVYNDEKSVATHFDLKMWVYVSENFDVRKLLKEILESAIQGRTEQLSMDILQNRLQKELSGKRYLLVLDDVWNENSGEWRRLKELLPCGAIGSKILVTTRSDIVARIMNALPGPPLGTLSADESWALFEKVAHPRTAAFVSIGEDILKKCGGVPLAIKTLGGMLLNVPSEREWQSVRDSELWKTQDHDGGILPALRLSYDNLTPSLKQCFAYCAVIPKGEAIDKDKLIKQWIAQGFIHSDDENELEEEGEKYFNALLQTSLFQQVHVKIAHNYSYKIHDLIHDLLKSVAGKECLVVEASMMNDLTRHLALFNDETRHLALCNEDWAGELKKLDALKKCKKLRSMITYGDDCPIDINVCLSFTCLRVLDLSDRSIHFLPNSIDKLRHLRYFDISCTEITELPETICNLHNLQTLRVLGIDLQKWPKNMKRMISLRHIEFNGGGDFPLPKGIGELTFLKTLPKSKFIITKESGDQIEELRDLNLIWGNIHIGGLDNITNDGCVGEADLKDLLKAKKHVNSLKLSWSGNETVAAEGNAKEVIEMLEPHSDLKELSVENYTGLGFPSWMTEKLTNLKKISLSSCKRCEWLPPLGQLDLLESLEIDTMDAVKHIVEFDGSHNYIDLFPSLKDLRLRNMPNLEGWSSPQEDGDEQGRERDKQVIFKCLRTLSISNCPKLICLPMFLLPALEELKMSEVGCESIECSRSHSLKSIILFNMPNLERWSLQEVDDDKDEQVTFRSLCTLNIFKCPKLICLPQLLFPALERLQMSEVGCERIELSRSHSLKSVSLRNMPNLERWSLQEVDDDKDKQVTFRSLCTLNISECPKLICLPQLLVPALERLQMTEVGCERIEFSRSHSLKSVFLWNMPNLERWSLQEVDDDKDEQVTFRSLCTLRISECPKLICLPQFLLPALEELKMEGVGCEKIEFFTSKSLKKVELTKMPNLERWSPQQADDDDKQVVFDDLVELVVKECPKMVRLPHFLPSLEKLKISESNEMLLRSVANYTSLFKLSIYGLPEVKHLPEELGPNHTSLHRLEIGYCPKLISLSKQLENLLALKQLIVEGCNDLVLSLSDGLQQQQRSPPPLNSLQVLEIINSCENQISLPGDGIVLTSLKSLKIVSCGNLESISADMLQNLKSLEIEGCPKLSSSLENLKSIETLMISGCPDMTRLLGSMKNLTSLRLLSIIDCPGLWSLPESTVKNLKSLTHLGIENCPGISSLPESMGDLESGIVLTSLRSLTIVSCGNLESISADMLQNLTSLEIEGCPKLSSSLENLKSIKKLMISGCPDMTRLLGSMENLTSLRLLRIIDCPGMWSLPESTVKNLKSLTSLRIENCPGISSLPESMGDLESLTSLRIENCPGITTLPHGLKRLRKLNHLQIERMFHTSGLTGKIQEKKNEEDRDRFIYRRR